MSATESREVLEAVIWRALTACHVRGTPVCGCKANVAAILGTVDSYAELVADSQVSKALAEMPQPPRMASIGELGCTADDEGWMCTAQKGHAMPHVAHVAPGRIMHAWDDTGRPA